MEEEKEIKIIENKNSKKILIGNCNISGVVKKYEIVRTENIRENNLILTIPLESVEICITT